MQTVTVEWLSEVLRLNYNTLLKIGSKLFQDFNICSLIEKLNRFLFSLRLF